MVILVENKLNFMRIHVNQPIRWILLLTVLCLSSYMTKAQCGVVVTLTSGTSTTYNVDSTGKLYIENGNLMVQESPGAAIQSNAVSNIRKITFTAYTNITTGVKYTASRSSQYSLYPNPTNDYITIAGIKEKVSVWVLSVEGKIMLSGNYSSGDNIDVSTLSSGAYVIRIDNSTLKFVKK